MRSYNNPIHHFFSFSIVQIKQTENFHANKITLCVMPAVPSEEDSANLVGHCRTLKAMRSALAGIPIVSTSWISACRSQKQAVMPFADMFVRTLPVKKGANSRSKAYADYGVAKIAAQASQRANHTLRSCIIHLLGSFTRPSKADVQLLLRESGAIVSLQTSTILATLRNAQNTDEQQVVLMCDDNYTHVTGALQRQVKATLESQTVESLIVVNPQWLFDSIISGGPANADEYAPTGKQPRELWELLQSKS